MTYCSVLSREKEGWSRDRLLLMIRLLTQVVMTPFGARRSSDHRIPQLSVPARTLAAR